MLLQVAGYAGGLYVARSYLRDRLEQLKEKMEAERVARDNLRRRFQQTQEDTSYTVLALLPTLSEQILQTMDLELLTNELQSRSKTRNKPSSTFPDCRKEGDGYSSLSSSVDFSNSLPQRVISDDLPAPVGTLDDPEALRLSDSFISAESVSQSWVAPTGSQALHSRSPTPSASATSSLAESSEENGDKEVRVQKAVRAGHEHSKSTGSNTTTVTMASLSPGSGETRSKTELWHEVKMLTFTRTLTTLYSTTLLCLFTTLQLTLLARSKYLSAILEQERDERIREQLEAGLTASNLVFGSLGLGPAAGSHLESLLSGGSVDDDELVFQGDPWKLEGVDEDAESKYLTLSWWLLHVGWKDVSERVRRAVEETFDGVSLKTKIAVMDLHQLIKDVRRRVEHEITFEGTERRTDFLSSLLPPTPETIFHVLTQGGYTPAPYPNRSFYTGMTKATESSLTSSQLSHDFANPPMATSPAHPLSLSATPPPHVRLLEEPFATLLSETRLALSSPDFAQVFEVCLDHATEIMFDSLEKNIFRPSSSHEGEGKGEEVRMRLAALLPGLAKWSQLALNGLPNELIDKTLGLREVSCFSAISFSRFEEQM